MDGCEILHQLKTVVYPKIFCWGFNHPKLVVQDFATIHTIIHQHKLSWDWPGDLGSSLPCYILKMISSTRKPAKTHSMIGQPGWKAERLGTKRQGMAPMRFLSGMLGSFLWDIILLDICCSLGIISGFGKHAQVSRWSMRHRSCPKIDYGIAIDPMDYWAMDIGENHDQHCDHWSPICHMNLIWIGLSIIFRCSLHQSELFMPPIPKST